jgi:5-formyltetrahydrofolate cyclo-ligase
MSSSNQLHKSELRQQAKAARAALADRAARSVAVFGHLSLCAEFQSAQTVLFYVSARTELETVPALAVSLAAGRSIAVP